MLKRTASCVAALLFCASYAFNASAQAPAGMMPQPGWQYDVGLGVIVNPEFQGADDYQTLAVPYFDIRYMDERGTKTFINVPQGIGRYFVRERTASGNRFALSAAIGPGFQNRDTDQFPGLETFGIGAEARLGAEYDVGRWSFQAQFAQAIASGHEGFYGDLSANYRWILGRRGAFAGFGPSLRFGDTTYMDALYGITTQENLATGLRRFDASGGLESVAAQGILSFPVSEDNRWRFTGVARVGQLVGDAGDSSLTAEENQFFIVMALTRRL